MTIVNFYPHRQYIANKSKKIIRIMNTVILYMTYIRSV